MLNREPSNSTALLNFVEASNEVSNNLKTQYGSLWQSPSDQIAEPDPYSEDKQANINRRFTSGDDSYDYANISDQDVDDVDDYAEIQQTAEPEEGNEDIYGEDEFIQQAIEKSRLEMAENHKVPLMQNAEHESLVQTMIANLKQSKAMKTQLTALKEEQK